MSEEPKPLTDAELIEVGSSWGPSLLLRELARRLGEVLIDRDARDQEIARLKSDERKSGMTLVAQYREKNDVLTGALKLADALAVITDELRHAPMAAMRVIVRNGLTDAFLSEATDAGVRDKLGTRSQAAMTAFYAYCDKHNLNEE